MQGLLGELSRRNVFRVGAAYGVVAWVIIQVTDSAVPALALPEWVNSLVFYLLLIGFPIVLLFAWAFEMTPEGVKRTEDVEADESVTGDTGQKLNRFLTVALAVAVAFLLYERFLPTDGEGTSRRDAGAPIVASAGVKTLAVLPFVNMSSDPEQEYFSDGITEEILNVLAGMRGLRVTSRTSAFAFKGQNLEIPVIAERLGVDHVLEGSVRKAGTRLRITAQLIEVGTDTHLWSQTYDREIEDIFAIQDEISQAIGDAMQVRLLGGGDAIQVAATGPRDHAAVDPVAYDYYLKARQGMNLANFESIANAERAALQAVALAPDFAEAQSLLAAILLQSGRDGSRSMSEVLGPAKAAAARALALDPNLSMAHLSMAWVAHAEQRHADERPLLERALELEPDNVDALSGLAVKVRDEDEGGEEKADRMMARAMALDPYNPVLLFVQGRRLRFEDRFAEALEIFARVKGITPDSPYGWLESGDVYADQGRFVEAITEHIVATEKDRLDPEIRVYIASFHLAVGDLEGARIWLHKANALDASSVFVQAGEMLYASQAGDDARVLELANGVLAPGSEVRHWSHIMANVYLISRRENEADTLAAVERYYGFVPGLRELAEGRITPADAGFGRRINPAMALSAAKLLRELGREEEALRIIESAEIFIAEADPEGRYGARGRLAALKGDNDAALRYLELNADEGMGELWRPVANWSPVYDDLRDDPRFQDYISGIEEDLAPQREELIAARKAAAE